MIKTQHCPNCEATEQKLHDFQQEVSDAVETHFKSYFTPYDLPDIFKQFIIKPDPLVEALAKVDFVPWKELSKHADDFRAALDAVGLEIREKGQ